MVTHDQGRHGVFVPREGLRPDELLHNEAVLLLSHTTDFPASMEGSLVTQTSRTGR